LSFGLDPNLCDLDGRTPLHIAAGLGDVELMRRLFFCGGRPELATSDGLTAMDLAMRAGLCRDVLRFLEPDQQKHRSENDLRSSFVHLSLSNNNHLSETALDGRRKTGPVSWITRIVRSAKGWFQASSEELASTDDTVDSAKITL